jgi:DNA primase
VVEGYLDVISLYQQGITNVVAALGTAITREHVDLLFRSVSELVICMDGDSAGQKAAWRAVTNGLPALRKGRQIKVLSLDEGEDPDSLIREKGAAHFERLVDEAEPLSSYFFDYLSKRHPLTTIEGRASFIEEAKPLLETLPAGTFSELMKKQLARTTNTQSAKTGSSSKPRFGSRQPARKKAVAPLSAMRHLIKLILHEPTLVLQLNPDEAWLKLNVPGMDVLNEIIQAVNSQQDMSPAMLLERFRGSQSEKIINVLFAEERLIVGELAEHEFLGAIERLKEQAKYARYHELAEKSQNLTDKEKKEFTELMK